MHVCHDNVLKTLVLILSQISLEWITVRATRLDKYLLIYLKC